MRIKKGGKTMRESSKAALSGIISALAVVVLLSTYISPFLVYTAPAFAGLLLLLILSEIGYKWALGSFFTISVLSLFLISDKEASVFFTMFFGYFPILSYFLSKKIKSGIIKIIIKFALFNISCILSYFLCIFIFGLPAEEITGEGIGYTIFLLISMNILFFLYDILSHRLLELYEKKFRKRFRKLFNLR